MSTLGKTVVGIRARKGYVWVRVKVEARNHDLSRDRCAWCGRAKTPKGRGVDIW